jgi:hypothetical protein
MRAEHEQSAMIVKDNLNICILDVKNRTAFWQK